MKNYTRNLTLTIFAVGALFTVACSNQPAVVYQSPQTAPQATVYEAPPANVVYAQANPCDAIYYNPVMCRQALGLGGYYNSLGVYMALSAMHDWAWYNSQETYYVHSHPGFRPTTVIINNPPARVQPRSSFTAAPGGKGTGTYTPPGARSATPAASYNGSVYKTQPGMFSSGKYSSPVTSAPKASAPVSRPATSSYTPRYSSSSSSFSSGRRFGK